MHRNWKVFFYTNKEGSCPIQQFLNSLEPREKAKALAWIGLLREHGIHLHRPFADFLTDGIHELRMRLAGDQIRVLYFFCHRDYIILTHDFVKNTDAIPMTEILKAKKYRQDFLSRYDAISLRRLENDIL